MVFTRPHTLLAAAALLQFAAAYKPAEDVTIVKTVTNTHTVCPATTKPPVCETTNVVDSVGGGKGNGNGNGNGNGVDNGQAGGHSNGNGNGNGVDNGQAGGHGNGQGSGSGNGNGGSDDVDSGFGAGKGPWGPHKPQNSADDNAAWQSWLDKLTKEANQNSESVSKSFTRPAWYDWQPTASTTGGEAGPTGGHGSSSSSGAAGPTGGHGSSTTTSKGSSPTGGSGFGGQCTEPEKGNPGKSDCNSAGDRSKWCGGKSIETDYYKDYVSGDTCKYTLEITNTTLSFDKGPVLSFAVNGQSPGPVIECNWGDWVQIKVINKLQTNATTIHWHGVHQKDTNDMDGVPGVSECGIAPGGSKLYEFRASSYGTAWYHAHLLSQYGDGIRGPMIFHGPATANYDLDMGTVMITDLFPAGTAAAQADRIAHFGQSGTTNWLLNGNNKTPDLATGKHALWSVQKGKKHLFRFINGAAQDMYSVRFDGHKMTVIAADFVPIEPYETEWLNIACGQRYDVIIEANQPSANYFLRAVTQKSCPSTCANDGLGLANGIIHYDDAVLTMPNSTWGNRTAASFNTCADEPIAKIKPFLKKTAGSAAAFTAGQKALPAGRVAQPNTNNNNTVVQWFINNNIMDINYTQPTLQTLANNPNIVSGVNATNGTDSIRNAIVLGQKNEWTYFIIRNQFFASHPMHLHGHDMSLLGQGNGEPDVNTLNFQNPVRRDTIMLNGSPGPAQGGGPLGYSVIGFQTDNPGAWLMHCHIVWHVEGGMALQFIERPQDINAGKYTKKDDFKQECAAMSKYEENPANRKHVGQSGLKRGLEGINEDVVRRDMNRHAHSHGRL